MLQGLIHVTSLKWLIPNVLLLSFKQDTWNNGHEPIYVSASNTNMKWATSVITVTASGKMLPSMILKGASNGQIAQHVYSTHPDCGHYRCQKQVDGLGDGAQVDWPHPHPTEECKGTAGMSILILNAYCTHMVGVVVNWLQSLRLRLFTPPLAANICESIDIGINEHSKA
jgi:hypothetical protein